MKRLPGHLRHNAHHFRKKFLSPIQRLRVGRRLKRKRTSEKRSLSNRPKRLFIQSLFQHRLQQHNLYDHLSSELLNLRHLAFLKGILISKNLSEKILRTKSVLESWCWELGSSSSMLLIRSGSMKLGVYLSVCFVAGFCWE